MKRKPWVRMPSEWIRHEGLKKLQWNDAGAPKSHKVAALQLYVAISLTAGELELDFNNFMDAPVTAYASNQTYSELMKMTGLSRSLVAGGLKVLADNEIIKIRPHGKRNIYEFHDYNRVNGWCKLPCRALWNERGHIPAFLMFSLRNKYELYGIKLWLYLLQVRENTRAEVNASYEKINAGTGIPEKEIPRTYSYLCGVGLLLRVAKETEDSINGVKTINGYYVIGYKDFFVGQAKEALAAAT